MNHLQIAQSYIGKEEVPRGSNWGAFVQTCLASVGIAFPAAWCQAFVYRVLKEGGVKSHRTGGCLECWRNSPNKLLAKDATPENVLPGYQFIYDHGHGKGHTGFVESVLPKGTMVTIEGNSNTDGSRDGYAVVRLKRRTIHDAGLLGFIKHTLHPVGLRRGL